LVNLQENPENGDENAQIEKKKYEEEVQELKERNEELMEQLEAFQ